MGGPEPSDQAPADVKPETSQLVTFYLDNQEFAFKIMELQEIPRMLPLTPLPKAPPYLSGITNLRGTIIPIIDLKIKLGLNSATRTKQARIMVVHSDGKIVGLIVDAVNEVIRVDASKLNAPPSLVANNQFKAVGAIVNLEKRLILLLDLSKILAQQPTEKLQFRAKVAEPKYTSVPQPSEIQAFRTCSESAIRVGVVGPRQWNLGALLGKIHSQLQRLLRKHFQDHQGKKLKVSCSSSNSYCVGLNSYKS